MNTPDPYELLKRLKPSNDHAQTSATLDDTRLAAIMATPNPRRRRRRRFIWFIGLFGLGTGSVAVAWAYLARDTAHNPLSIACAQTATATPNLVVVPANTDPVAACAIAWTDGRLGTGNPPELHACVSKHDVATVYPGPPDVCHNLGLSDLNLTRTPVEDTLVQLQQQLIAIYGNKCVAKDKALTDVRATLDKLGLTDWKIGITAAFTMQRPCTAIGIDPTTKTVFIASRRKSTS